MHDPNPGNDQHIVFRVGLDGQGGLSPDADDAPIRWTHYCMEEEDAKHLMVDRRLEEHVAEDLTVSNARPRAKLFVDGLLVVLRGVNCNSGAQPEDMVSVRAWVDDARIVSVSPRPVLAIEEVHRSLQKANGPRSAIEVLASIATQLVDRIAPVVDGLEEQLDDLLSTLLEQGPKDVQRPLAHLRNVTTQLRRHMAPQRDALRQMLLMQAPMTDATRDSLSQVADRQSRYVEDLDAVRERATVMQDELTNTIASNMNRNMYLMSVIAAVFLPLGLLTGLLGINVGGMPGATSPLAFWLVCALLVLIAAAEVLYFRRRGLI